MNTGGGTRSHRAKPRAQGASLRRPFVAAARADGRVISSEIERAFALRETSIHTRPRTG